MKTKLWIFVCALLAVGVAAAAQTAGTGTSPAAQAPAVSAPDNSPTIAPSATAPTAPAPTDNGMATTPSPATQAPMIPTPTAPGSMPAAPETSTPAPVMPTPPLTDVGPPPPTPAVISAPPAYNSQDNSTGDSDSIGSGQSGMMSNDQFADRVYDGDYRVLDNGIFDHQDLMLARNAGYSWDSIDQIVDLARITGQSFTDILNLVEDGYTLPVLADKYGVRIDELSNDKGRQMVDQYRRAYRTTGYDALQNDAAAPDTGDDPRLDALEAKVDQMLANMPPAGGATSTTTTTITAPAQ